MMRILFVTPYYPPGIGGACRLLEGYVNHLIGRGHQVEVVTFGEPLYKGAGEWDATQPYKVYRVPAAQQRGRDILAMTRLVLARTVGKPKNKTYDLVLTGVAFPCAVMAYLVKCLTGIPFAICSLGEDVSVVKGSSWKARSLATAFRKAAVVFAASRFTRAETVDLLGLKDVAIQVLPPGINPPPVTEDTKALAAEMATRLELTGKRVLLTVARLTSPRKGHDTVVRAMRLLVEREPSLHYVVVGKGEQETLRKLAQDEGVAERLTIVPTVTDAELTALYSLAEIYVMPSRRCTTSNEVEGFGMVYLEAAACGVPSVAGNEGGVADAIVDNVTGLLVSDPASPEQVAAALSVLLSNETLRKEMGEAGRKRVFAEFTSDILNDRLVNELTQAVHA